MADLVQLLQLTAKSAVLTITHEDERSRLWCAQGVVIDAESGRLRGVAAAYRILALEVGWLEAELRPVSRTRCIQPTTQHLLLCAAQRKDEANVLRHKLGDVRRCYRLELEPSAEQLALSAPAELRLLRLLASTRSLREMLAVSELGDLETLQAIERWLEAGYIVPAGARSESAPEANPTLSLVPIVASMAARVPPRRRASSRGPWWILPCLAAALAGGYLLRGDPAGESALRAATPNSTLEPASVAAHAGVATQSPSATATPGQPSAIAEAAVGVEELPAEPARAVVQAPRQAADVTADLAPRQARDATADVAPRQAADVAASAPERRAARAAHGVGSTARAARGQSLARRDARREPRVRIIGAPEPSVRVLD